MAQEVEQVAALLKTDQPLFTSMRTEERECEMAATKLGKKLASLVLNQTDELAAQELGVEEQSYATASHRCRIRS